MRISRRLIARILLLPFIVLTLYAVATVGYVGIFDYQRHSPAGWQVFADLVIALLFVLTWLVPDARKNQRNPVVWIIATLFLGSIGPLVYLATSAQDNQA